MRTGEDMKRVAVVYGTKSGCTEGIAQRIGEVLTAQGAQVDIVAAQSAGSADGYDAVVVGSGLRAGSWHGSARTWLTDNAEVLKSIPVALFTVGLTIREADKRDAARACTDALLESTGVEPVDVGLFAGWNEPAAFSLPERMVLKLLKAPIGDFRDFDEVGSWAQTVAPRLMAEV